MKTIPLLRISRSNLRVVLVTAAFFVQTVIIFLSIIKPLAIEITSTRGYPATERSAILGFGDRFAQYIEFIRSRTPNTEFVLIPYRETNEVLGNEGIMQYFLLPRKISNCPVTQPFEECLRIQAGPNTFILSVDGFPPQDIRESAYRYVPFNDEWGIYVPSNYD